MVTKTRALGGLVSDSGPLSDGLLSAADIGALPLTGGTLTGTITFAGAQTFPGTQAALVSGTNIKTVNGNSVLGSGDIVIAGGVTSFNTRTGAITLSSGDVTGALGFTPGTGDVTLDGTQTITGTKSFTGTPSTLAVVLNDAAEVATVSATAATGVINYDITTQSVMFYTANASANWTVNFRGSSGTSLNTLLAIGQSVTAAFLVTQGATAFFNNAIQIDGSVVTRRWQGGTAPSAGNANGVDAYVYTIIKTANATYTVLASQTRFA
jgi:hypothetical protein